MASPRPSHTPALGATPLGASWPWSLTSVQAVPVKMSPATPTARLLCWSTCAASRQRCAICLPQAGARLKRAPRRLRCPSRALVIGLQRPRCAPRLALRVNQPCLAHLSRCGSMYPRARHAMRRLGAIFNAARDWRCAARSRVASIRCDAAVPKGASERAPRCAACVALADTVDAVSSSGRCELSSASSGMAPHESRRLRTRSGHHQQRSSARAPTHSVPWAALCASCASGSKRDACSSS